MNGQCLRQNSYSVDLNCYTVTELYNRTLSVLELVMIKQNIIFVPDVFFVMLMILMHIFQQLYIIYS